MTLTLATNTKDAAESEGDTTELTPMSFVVTPKTSRPSSKKLAVGKK
jgi:hypothetical protein